MHTVPLAVHKIKVDLRVWNGTSLQGHARERLVIAAGLGDREPERDASSPVPLPTALPHNAWSLLGVH